MRRLLIIIGLLVSVLAISCDPAIPPQSGDGYSVSSDVRSISGVPLQSRSYAEEGDAIIGVLLLFDGGDEFHIEYLDGDIRENGDGMQYNYILHIPGEISEAYAAGGGHNPGSGNPFWWYMAHYFGLSKTEIENNYKESLGLLLSNLGQKLPAAVAGDVDLSWKSAEEFVSLEDKTVGEGRLILIDPDPQSDSDRLSVASQSTGPFVTLDGYGDIIRRAFYINPDGKLYFPMELVDVYCEYRGDDYKYTGSGDPLWKYMETYFGVTLSDARKDMTTVLQKLRDNQDSLPYPSAADYIAAVPVPDDPDEISGYEEFFDSDYGWLDVDAPDMIFADIENLPLSSQLSSDAAYEQDRREYCWKTFTIREDRPKLYYPVALIKAYWEYSGEFTTSGTPFWTYMRCYFPESGLVDIDHVRQIGFEHVMNFIVEHKDGMPYPDVDDYIRNLGPAN